MVKGRLIAYTSDLGESFRPVVPRWVVRFAYGITWAYVGIDVAYNTAEEHVKGSAPMTVLRTAVHAATFQSIASVLVPSIVIHQVRGAPDPRPYLEFCFYILFSWMLALHLLHFLPTPPRTPAQNTFPQQIRRRSHCMSSYLLFICDSPQPLCSFTGGSHPTP